jgi:hypothetical protein
VKEKERDVIWCLAVGPSSHCHPAGQSAAREAPGTSRPGIGAAAPPEQGATEELGGGGGGGGGGNGGGECVTAAFGRSEDGRVRDTDLHRAARLP